MYESTRYGDRVYVVVYDDNDEPVARYGRESYADAQRTAERYVEANPGVTVTVQHDDSGSN